MENAKQQGRDGSPSRSLNFLGDASQRERLSDPKIGSGSESHPYLVTMPLGGLTGEITHA